MQEVHTYFITWTTYGTWLPGDPRGWRKPHAGEQLPQPRLAEWVRRQMRGAPVVLNAEQRERVRSVCVRHAEHRGWTLHAIAVRSNHVHLVVTADAAPGRVRDQFKANSTRVLRDAPNRLRDNKVWTRGGDTRLVDGDLEHVVLYVEEAQDRKDRGE